MIKFALVAAVVVISTVFFPILLFVWIGWLGLYLYRRAYGKTPEEREMIRYAKAAAKDEAERIRLQTRIDREQERIISKARQDAGLDPVKKGMGARVAHEIGNVGRDFLLQKRQPFDPYKYKK